MNSDQVLKEFEKAGALLRGHFILSSGLHSDVFLQKALVFQNAKITAKLCKALAAKVREEVKTKFTAIISPAVGGIVPGLVSSVALTPGGGGGIGVPKMLFSSHFPRSTGDVRSGYDVVTSRAPWARRPPRSLWFGSVTRRKRAP